MEWSEIRRNIPDSAFEGPNVVVPPAPVFDTSFYNIFKNPEVVPFGSIKCGVAEKDNQQVTTGILVSNDEKKKALSVDKENIAPGSVKETAVSTPSVNDQKAKQRPSEMKEDEMIALLTWDDDKNAANGEPKTKESSTSSANSETVTQTSVSTVSTNTQKANPKKVSEMTEEELTAFLECDEELPM